MRYIIAAIFLITSTLNTSAYAYECWGWKPQKILDAYDDTDAVFIGVVDTIEETEKRKTTLGSTRHEVTFLAKKVWKGFDPSTLPPNTKPSFTIEVDDIYEYDFKIHNTYLIIAYKIHNDETLSVVGCPRSAEVKHAKQEIAQLPTPIFPQMLDQYTGSKYTQNDMTSTKQPDLPVASEEMEDIDIPSDINNDEDIIDAPITDEPVDAPPPPTEENGKSLDSEETPPVVSPQDAEISPTNLETPDLGEETETHDAEKAIEANNEEELPLLPDL